MPTATAPLPHEAVSADVLRRGDVVERYTVLHKVGVGGMGEVYAAYDVVLDRKVALKVLRHTNAEFELRLMREAQAMARLSHPNVVAVYDTGRVQGRLLRSRCTRPTACAAANPRPASTYRRGEKPFPGKTGNERMTSTVEGRLAEAPKRTQVPTRIRRILLRGLSTERDARYPSIDALLHDLTRAPSQRKWHVVVAASLVAAASVGRLLAHKSAQARQARVCSGAEEESAEVWNEDVQQRIEGAVLATALPYAADTWQRTRLQIGEHMSHWTTVHRQTCEATRLHRYQSEAVMTVRMVCLEQRRDEVRALTQVLAAADRDVVSKAHQAATALTNPDACKNVTSLMAADPLPAEPARRAEVDAIRQGMASAGAYLEAGKHARARDEIEPLVVRATRLGYAPVQAEALLLEARAHAEVGTEREVSIREATEAAFDADRGRVDETRAPAAIQLTRWETDVGRYADAEIWSKLAEAALHRAGDSGEGRIEWLRAVGVVLNRQGKHQEASERNREALETARRMSVAPQRVAELERCLATPLAALGQHEEATRLALDADNVLRRAVGDEHPSRIDFLYTLGNVAREGNDARTSLGYLEHAIGLAERVDPDSSRLPAPYYNACSCQCELGDYAGALSNCEKSIASGLRMYGPDSIHMSYAYGDTGDALAKLHRYDQAIGYYERAIRIDEKSGTEGVRTLLHALMGIGQGYLHMGKRRDAIAALERALALSQTSEGRSEAYQSDDAGVRFALAQALWESGTRTPRTVGLARVAADAFEHLADGAKAEEASRWLGAHVVR